MAYKLNRLNIRVVFNNQNVIIYHCSKIELHKQSLWLLFKHRTYRNNWVRLNLNNILYYDVVDYKDSF